MTRSFLIQQIKEKKSFLCVGLDPDLEKLPPHLLSEEDPIYSFNKAIIEATEDLCVAYKPNIAFYECYGEKGWKSLRKTNRILPANCLQIADAKRGDIGNTASRYAKTFFEKESAGLEFDALTVAPYMGKDSVVPFLEFKNKWVILLALTSNEGSFDFQFLETNKREHLFETVLRSADKWGGTKENMMYVAGATRGENLSLIRKHAPDHFLLVPGVGAQGGSLSEVCKYGMTKDCGLLVNSTRSIIYASKGKDFAEKAREKALELKVEMQSELERKNII